MTREEAIEIFNNGGWWDMLIPVTTIGMRNDEYKLHEAIDVAISALTPPTQEQVERVWPGCPHCTQTNARQNLGYQYCEHCGRPLTPAAWEELRKRREALWSIS